MKRPDCPCCGATDALIWNDGYPGNREEPAEPEGYECRKCGKFMDDPREVPELPAWSYCPNCQENDCAEVEYNERLGRWVIVCAFCGDDIYTDPGDLDPFDQWKEAKL
jgi:hypothetical protein